MLKITSPGNPRYKLLQEIRLKKRARRREGRVAVEGLQEVKYALDAGLKLLEVWTCSEHPLPFPVTGADHLLIPADLFDKISYRGKDARVVGVFEIMNPGLSELNLGASPLVIVLDDTEKPGNIGAVMRSAYAAGADLVCLTGNHADPWNPNTIRSSVGCLFKQKWVEGSREEILTFLRASGIRILATRLENAEIYYRANLSSGTALVMGEEHSGLSDWWMERADGFLTIPMQAGVDSLNLSVSTAILLFEAKRQREGNGTA